MHYAHGPHGNACGRASSRSTTNVYRVDCLNCKGSDQFLAALAKCEAVKQEKFEAQVPQTFFEPWHMPYNSILIVCKSCGGNTFRQGDRTCHGHYDNWHCSNCGGVESRLTETGMSF